MTDSDLRSDPFPIATKEQEIETCDKCGATMRLDSGVCVSCLLREGLEGGHGVSQASYQTVLAEVDTPHKSWFLGNYEIFEQIGCGGMGVIYRARQRHSRRIVAIKRVLSYRADSHGALQRFRREAQAVASLDHPNILPIYEVSESEDGLPFFSMKFAEKGSLHQNVASLRDQTRKCVELMAKVARAVEYAHSRGVLHRDIKPGNILLDDRGEPQVSDFGLAKLLDENNDLTRSLTTFGTAGFIAPEQAGHAAVDFTPVADVYSVGAVLFNVLAGRPPFLGSNPVSVIRQSAEMPAPKLRSIVPSLDKDLETICARCLERDPRARYQSAGDLATDLQRWLDRRPIIARPVSTPARMWRWSRRNPKLVGATLAGLLLGATAVWFFRAALFRPPQFNPPARSIAVLPFADSSETKDQGYLCDGITDEILDTLGTLQGLRVVGRNSSFAFKGKNTNPGEVGQKLNVGNVLEGSLRREGNRVRVTAELIDARNGFRIWTEAYDRELNGAFALQDEIASSIVDALKVKFGVQLSRHEQSADDVRDFYVQRLLTDVTNPTGKSSIGINVPLENSWYPSAVLYDAYPKDSESRRTNAGAIAAPPETAFNLNADRGLEAGLATNRVTANVIAAPPETVFNTNARNHGLEAALGTNKITANAAAAPPETLLNTNARDRTSATALRTNKITAVTTPPPAAIPSASVAPGRPFEPAVRTSKITANQPGSIQGFVKDPTGGPVKGAELRIESRDGKQVFSTVKTDLKGRYISRGLQPGVYRVTLIMNGAVKASIMNTQTNADQPTQLNFDLKQTSQANNIAKHRKHMVWVPNRTGSHIGGNWVEVDDEGNAHFDSNIQTYNVSR